MKMVIILIIFKKINKVNGGNIEKEKNIVLIITKNNLATALTSENNGQFLIKCKHQYIQQQ